MRVAARGRVRWMLMLWGWVVVAAAVTAGAADGPEDALDITTVNGLSFTSQLVVGEPVSGAGIPAGTTIASIVNATTITTSLPLARGQIDCGVERAKHDHEDDDDRQHLGEQSRAVFLGARHALDRVPGRQIGPPPGHGPPELPPGETPLTLQ